MLCVKMNTYFIIVLLCLNGEALLKRVQVEKFRKFSPFAFPSFDLQSCRKFGFIPRIDRRELLL